MANNTVAARIPKNLESALEAIAAISGQNVGSLIREALELYIQHEWTPQRIDEAMEQYRERQRRENDKVTQKIREAFAPTADLIADPSADASADAGADAGDGALSGGRES